MLLALPAVASASACPSFSNVSAFHGTASTSFSGSASSGTATWSLARTATGLELDLPKSASSSVATIFGAHATGGAISVDDHYTSGGESATQTASGPTESEVSTTQLVLFPGSCSYQLQVSWYIHTTVTSSFQPPPSSDRATGSAYMPIKPIPASLNLSGSATVPAYYGNCPRNPNGCYVYGASPSYFDQGFDDAKSCSGSSCTSGQPEGTATISWNLSPGTGPTSCSVGGGGTTASVAADPLAHAAQGTCQEEQNQEKKKAKTVAKYAGYFSAGAGAVTGVMAVVSAAVPGGQPNAVALAALTGGFGFLAYHFGVVASDPPDPNWRSIAKAKPIGVPRIPAGGFLGAAGVATLNGILRQMATVNGLEYAFYVSHNRESSAKAAHNSLWVKRQTAAMGRFAIHTGQALDKLIALIQQSKSTLSTPFPGITPAALKRAAKYVRAHGLPTSFLNLAHKYGLSGAVVAAIKRKLLASTGLPSYATSIYGIFSNPSLINSAQAEATALITYGQLLVAHP